jgi:hypothetical protein
VTAATVAAGVATVLVVAGSQSKSNSGTTAGTGTK